jgi:hypothetical protein
LDCENYEGSVALAMRKSKIRDGRKITQPVSKLGGVGSEWAAPAMLALEFQLDEEKESGTASARGRAGVATRQSTRSTRSSHQSCLGHPMPAFSIKATAGGVGKRRPVDISPSSFILSCTADTKAIVISVFHYLPNSDLCSSSLVCKAWLNTAFDQDLWDYDDGLADGLHGGVLMDASLG